MMTMPEQWTHRFTAEQEYRGKGYGGSRRIRVEAGLHKIGDQQPHFSATAEIFRPKAKDCDACGCLHDEILAYWPKLRPIVDLHLSDDTGTPMHAEANAWYQLAGYYGGANEQYHAGNSLPAKTSEDCLVSFAKYVRISPDAARDLAETFRATDDWKTTRLNFRVWIASQAERWQQEATDGIALLDSLRSAE